MPLTRRAFAQSLMTTPLAAGGLALSSVQANAASLPKPSPHVTVPIGRFTVHVLTDGFGDIPYGFFRGQAVEETAVQAKSTHVARPGDTLRIGFAQYLIEVEDRLILVDTGPAGTIGENTGRLPSALSALGVQPSDIDALILTHTHFDHISGAVLGGQTVFTNAETYVDRRDIAYFTDPGKRSVAPDFLLSSFDATAELLRLYPRLQQVQGDHDILPGLSIVDLTGHTPGHIGVRVADAGRTMLIVSDMPFHPIVLPQKSHVGFVFEQDAAAAEAMRQDFFPMAADDGSLIAATHMPFPGLGRIGRDAGKLTWVPENWPYV